MKGSIVRKFELPVDYNGHEIFLYGNVSMAVEPAQHGGRTDPSWESYCCPVEAEITDLILDGVFEMEKGDRFFDRIINIPKVKDTFENCEFERECEWETENLRRRKFYE